MTPKRRTRSVTKPAKSPTSSAARRGSPARRAASSVATPGAGPPVKPRAAPSAAASVPALKPGPALTALPPAEPTLLERAERLRDDVLRSKLTHPDPWTYTAKARAWGEGIQALVAEIAVAGQTPGLHARLTTLSAEVEGDSDFQRARQLF